MAPIFEFHGLTVDCIDYHKPNSKERKKHMKLISRMEQIMSLVLII